MSFTNLLNKELVSLFKKQACWQIEPLANLLGYSVPSVRRYLKLTGYHRSFSHNGKWYTLHHVPKFNKDGLWFSGDIGFSRDGNLNKTLIRLITKSPSGMTAEDLKEKLRCRPHTVLVKLCRQGHIQREKAGRSFVYFAQDPRIAANQRLAMSSLRFPHVTLQAEIAVLVLAKFIRNPHLSFQQLAEALNKTAGVSIDSTQVEKLFEQHGLKKTLHNAQHRL